MEHSFLQPPTHLRLESLSEFASGQLHLPVTLQDRHEVVHELDVSLVARHSYPWLFQRVAAAVRVAARGATSTLGVLGLVLNEAQLEERGDCDCR